MTVFGRTVSSGLDALPYGLVAGVVTYIVTKANETGLPALVLAMFLGVVVFGTLATISLNVYRVDGTAFPVTRFLLFDVLLYWP